MNRLTIAGTRSSPFVDFDPSLHRLTIVGQMYPENAFKFFEPLMDWIHHYLQQLEDTQPCELALEISYMNTSSTKCMMMLLERLDEASIRGKQLSVVWTCNPDNEGEFECAEELREDLQLPFVIRAKSDEGR